MNDLVGELQSRLSLKGWESGRRSYVALVAEKFSFLEILEIAIRRQDQLVIQCVIAQKLKSLKYSMAFLQYAPFFGLFTLGVLLSVSSVFLGVISAYTLFSLGVITYAIFKEKDLGQFVKVLSYGLFLIGLCGGAAKGIAYWGTLINGKLIQEGPSRNASTLGVVTIDFDTAKRAKSDEAKLHVSVSVPPLETRVPSR
ncbi:hypothetical protein [Geothrix sp. 21YS21S-4]|uniref:hypothetical protein n=1 Tax=Geothrix sp. 21YS21S-4 TaxID=3068889 RepID=UPI0027B9A935|nr:hypothetical protein [Geothrix sp. 21YS21S-4]